MKIAILGSGVRTPFVVHALAERRGELGVDRITLHDTDGERLEIMTALLRHLLDVWGARELAIAGDADARHTVADARFVVSAIRVGQEAARARDERIALAHGVLGQETTGAAGFAMAMRTIPSMVAYARLIADAAPGALLLDMTNPVGIVVQAVADATDVEAVGVCDSPVEMKRSLAAFLGVPVTDILIRYAGLNHCGWIRQVVVAGEDRMPEILDRYDALAATHPAWRLFDAPFVRRLGMLPSEYLYFFYDYDRAVERVKASGGTRGEQLRQLNDDLWCELGPLVEAGDLAAAVGAWGRAMHERGSTYLARERGDPVVSPAPDGGEGDLFEGHGYEGVATAVMQAATSSDAHELVLDVAAADALPGFDADDVVEISCEVGAGIVRPIGQPPLAPDAHSLVRTVKSYERRTIEAALARSRDAAIAALRVHPLIASEDLARSLVDAYARADPETFGDLR